MVDGSAEVLVASGGGGSGGKGSLSTPALYAVAGGDTARCGANGDWEQQ